MAEEFPDIRKGRGLDKVFILTRRYGEDMEIVAVFRTAEALEKRIVAMVRSNNLAELSGLGMQSFTVMES